MGTPTHEVDGTVVEETIDPPPPVVQQSGVSMELAPRERRNEVVKPLDLDQVVETFQHYQAMLPKLLDASDWQGSGDDRFVKKSGWRKIATAFDLDVQRVSETVERAPDGTPLRAMAVWRAIAPSGRAMDGDGYCSIDESRFANGRGRQKLENDLRATATTRAKNRAISDLVGMGAVSAEEVGGAGDQGGRVQLPAWAAEPSPAQLEQLCRALAYLLGDTPDGPRVSAFFSKVATETETPVPVRAVARSLALLAGEHYQLIHGPVRQAPPQQPEPTPEPEPTQAQQAAAAAAAAIARARADADAAAFDGRPAAAPAAAAPPQATARPGWARAEEGGAHADMAEGLHEVPHTRPLAHDAPTPPAVQQSLDPATPPPGTVDLPPFPQGGYSHPAAKVKALRDAGCICPDPINVGNDEKAFDPRCPIKGHPNGIPF